MLMHWTFDWGWCLGGIAVLVAGALIVKFHQAIANNLASGVASYDKVKLFGIIMSVIGLLVTANLHIIVLELFVKFITGK